MKNKTKFFDILKKARTDEVSLVLVMNKIMPIITKFSIDNNKRIDEDMRSALIEYAISIIKSSDFADKLAKIKK